MRVQQHLAAFCIGVLASVPASASDEDGTGLVTKFEPKMVIDTLREVGANGVANEETASGEKYITLVYRGVTYRLFLHACSPDNGCLGLNMLAGFSGDAGGYDLQKVNDFNTKYVFASAKVRGDTLLLSRYVICDGGITRDNLRYNFTNFAGMPEVLAKHLYPQEAATRSVKPAESRELLSVNREGSLHSPTNQHMVDEIPWGRLLDANLNATQ